ncbi:MAG: septum formation initiator family protein [Patescibacteria group bacterium]|nr:septum formation initiator family protein [Patescibacteria group bacterium]
MRHKFNKKRKPKNKRNIFLPILLGLLSLTLIVFLANTNIKMKNRRTELISQSEMLKNEIVNLEEKKKEMESRIYRAESKEYLEEVARNELGWQIPGEEVVVVTKDDQERAEREQEQEKKSYWQEIKDFLSF